MFSIEMLLSKIAFTILKKAVIAPVLGTIFKVVSVIETITDLYHCIETTNDCKQLGIFGLKVGSGQLTEVAYDTLIKMGKEEFSIQKTSGGIYVASKIVPAFVATPADFPKFAASPIDFPKFTRR